MCAKVSNTAIFAAAGSRKTEGVVDAAIACTAGAVLVLTYTIENQTHVKERIRARVGHVPSHIHVMGWFAFLIAQCAKPYQSAITGSPLMIRGLNFKGRHSKYTPKTSLGYFIDQSGCLYRDDVADFVCEVNRRTNGAVIHRLERMYAAVFIDEVQDLAGYDLELIDALLDSAVETTVVGDPRQCTLVTNYGTKNKKYRGGGLIKWFEERDAKCNLVFKNQCYRSNQAICDFADSIFPSMAKTEAVGVSETGHDGVFKLHEDKVLAYMREHQPIVLRDRKNVDTMGLPAVNIGIAKGRTYDRVLLFPTKPMLQFLADGDPSKLKAPDRLYVAVTRARYSVAIVVPSE